MGGRNTYICGLIAIVKVVVRYDLEVVYMCITEKVRRGLNWTLGGV